MSDRVKVWQSDEDGKWRFTYWSSSDRIAWSEGYEDKSYTIKMAEKLYPGVPVEVVEPEGDAQVNPRTLLPGTVVRHSSGGTVTLARRKADESGWWNTDGSGLDDRAWAADGTWAVITEGDA